MGGYGSGNVVRVSLSAFRLGLNGMFEDDAAASESRGRWTVEGSFTACSASWHNCLSASALQPHLLYIFDQKLDPCFNPSQGYFPDTSSTCILW